MRPTPIFAIFALLAAFAVARPAHAYFSTIDNGELVTPGQYQIGIEPQIVFDRYNGFNGIGRFDTGINESSSVRGILGFGKVDFELGAMYKWIPFPDVDNQPAIGGEAGMILARVNNSTEVSVRFHPLISKLFETEVGDVIPYASLPLGVTGRSDKTVIPVQLVGGAELRPLNMPSLSFFGEIGLNINEAFSYISVAAAYRFDDATIREHVPKK